MSAVVFVSRNFELGRKLRCDLWKRNFVRSPSGSQEESTVSPTRG